MANQEDDLTTRIATRAYELYEQRGRRQGRADQDWLEAEREIRKPRDPETARSGNNEAWGK
jgi:Protein of unknown function (DUF2934)